MLFMYVHDLYINVFFFKTNVNKCFLSCVGLPEWASICWLVMCVPSTCTATGWAGGLASSWAAVYALWSMVSSVPSLILYPPSHHSKITPGQFKISIKSLRKNSGDEFWGKVGHLFLVYGLMSAWNQTKRSVHSVKTHYFYFLLSSTKTNVNLV